MSIKKSIITPNYERMRESFCHALQDAWNNYCKANSTYLKSIRFNEKGEMIMINTEIYKKKLDEASAEFKKAQQDLVDFDVWMGVEKQWDIFREKFFGED